MKIKKVLPALMISLLLTGCWDNIEIDKRAFVSTIGIDVGKDIKERDSLKALKPTDAFSERPLDILNVTYGFPDIRNMEKDKGTAEELAISVGGYSMTDTYFKALRESSRTLHFGHSKVLFLSDRIFRYPEVAKEVMDFIEREPSLNRTMIMAVVEGSAEDYIKYKPLTEENIENYIVALMGNNSKNGSVYPVTLNAYIDALDQSTITMLPYFRLEEGDKKSVAEKSEGKDKPQEAGEKPEEGEKKLVLTGITLIKDNEIVGYLNDKQVTDIQLLRGDIGSCKKVIYREGHPVDYYIRDVATKLKIDLVDNKLIFNYNIFVEGTIKGYYTDANLLDQDLLNAIQKDFKESMEKELISVADMAQNEYKADVFNIEERLRKYHPKIWKVVQKRWPEAYYNAEVRVKVDNYIRTVGLTN